MTALLNFPKQRLGRSVVPGTARNRAIAAHVCVGLAILLHLGSPQSKEGDDRMEAKLDAILLAVDPEKAERILNEIDEEYAGRHTDARFVRLLEEGSTRYSAHVETKSQ